MSTTGDVQQNAVTHDGKVGISAAERQERAVGIDKYVSPDAPGFDGVLKQRYTDFLVNEIEIGGKVLHLTQEPAESGIRKRKREYDEPAVEEQAKKVKSEGHDDDNDKAKVAESPDVEAPQQDEVKPTPEGTPVQVDTSIPDDGKATLLNIFGDETVKDMLKLYVNILRHPTKKARDHDTITSQPIEEKAKRTEAHGAVRKILDARLETSTVHETNCINIRAAPPRSTKSDGGKGLTDRTGAKQKGKLGWDQLGGEYLHFNLYKENKDTMEVLFFIASQLKLAVRNFSFAGTKDRRGVTVQRVCVFRVHIDRLLHAQKTARGWRIGGFEYKKHGLELGELLGNEFAITLRDCHFPGEGGLNTERRLELAKKALSEATLAFGRNGFINYYGLQRFGAFSTGTHMIGMKLLQGKLDAAVDSILSFEPALLKEDSDMNNQSKIPTDDIRRAKSIHHWLQNKDAKDALALMPKRFQAEYSIIQYLGKRDKKVPTKLIQQHDWQGALMSIQRNLRLMYVHAYQSLIWNTVAGKRWEKYGNKVVEGDLVIVGEKEGNAAQAAQEQEVDEVGEPIVRPAADDTAASAEDNFVRARPLSKEEAESGKYSIFDIVLALPGWDVIYPKNEVGTFYKELMGSEKGGNLDPHDMRRAWKDISLSGSYRKMMSKPGNLSFEVVEYRDRLAQLIDTDVDRINKQATNMVQPNGVIKEEDCSGQNPTEQQDDKEQQESRLAVLLHFQLGSSQYATMALRELMKGGAASYQPEFNTQR